MKVLTYAITVILFFTSAAYPTHFPDRTLEKQIIGKWKFTGQTGGFIGKSEPANPTVTNIIEFKKGGKYVRYTNGEPMFQGDYELIKAKSIYSGKADNAIRFDPKVDSPLTGDIVTLQGDTLRLADNFNDGYTSGYVRIN